MAGNEVPFSEVLRPDRRVLGSIKVQWLKRGSVCLAGSSSALHHVNRGDSRSSDKRNAPGVVCLAVESEEKASRWSIKVCGIEAASRWPALRSRWPMLFGDKDCRTLSKFTEFVLSQSSRAPLLLSLSVLDLFGLRSSLAFSDRVLTGLRSPSAPNSHSRADPGPESLLTTDREDNLSSNTHCGVGSMGLKVDFFFPSFSAAAANSGDGRALSDMGLPKNNLFSGIK